MSLKNCLIVFNSILIIIVVADTECGLQNVTCDSSMKYRSIDGACNNLKHPNWGTVRSKYIRFLPAKYGDGVHSFALTKQGTPLPNARNLTLYIYTEGFVDTCERITLSAMTFGQTVAHDLSFTFLPTPRIQCCTNFLKKLDTVPAQCANIKIPAMDPYYSNINATCLPMVRTVTNQDVGCDESSTQAQQITKANNYLDLSIIYGHTYERYYSLRAFTNGLMLVEERKNHEWPPSAPVSSCSGLLKFETRCYRTGDVRFIQNPQLTITHILWLRNHNKIARRLAKINPNWNDEKLFQVARSINIAQYQHIVYYELLPVYAGLRQLMQKKVLYDVDDEEYVNDYDEDQEPHVYNEFAQAAFRQFHSLIAGKLGLFNSDGCLYDSLVLRDHIDRPVALEKEDIYDSLIRGLALQQQMPSDIFYDSEFTREMFIGPMRFGQDIKSVDIQRSRDHGLPSYNDMRAFCGLPKADDFNDFLDVMPPEHLHKLMMFYNDPDDVDLIVGGSLEENVEGTLAGPTFLCIIYIQFRNIRRSDRFWYENRNSGFTRQQLREIRKSTVAKIFCDNGNNITYMQKSAFIQPSFINPEIECDDIEGPNLLYWRDLDH